MPAKMQSLPIPDLYGECFGSIRICNTSPQGIISDPRAVSFRLSSFSEPGRVEQTMGMKQNSHEMIIWWSAEDDAYVVDVPELPGCMAHGATRQTAIKNAEAAIKFWIKTATADGKEIPQPRGRLLVA